MRKIVVWELFGDDGHLQDQAFDALIHGDLDDLSRLEIAEHLSYCDECLVRYETWLTDDALPPMEASVLRPVMGKIRADRRRDIFRRCMSAGLAAGLTLVLWGAGVFQGLTQAGGEFTGFELTFADRFTQGAAAMNQNFVDQINQIFESFSLKGVLGNE